MIPIRFPGAAVLIQSAVPAPAERMRTRATMPETIEMARIGPPTVFRFRAMAVLLLFPALI